LPRSSFIRLPLLGRFGLGLLFALVPVVLLLELLHAAGGIDELHLTGEEGMARRADFDGDVLLSAAGDELVATATGHGRLNVFGMNAGFHGTSLSRSIVGFVRKSRCRLHARHAIVELCLGERQGQSNAAGPLPARSLTWNSCRRSTWARCSGSA